MEALPDGLFSACAALKRLVLEHKKAPCAIAPHSLDELNSLHILVPAAAYPFYRDGYGCAENPWRAYLSQIVTY